MTDCPFCSVPGSAVIARNERFLALADGFPVSPGHTLIVPVRHAASFFDLDDRERQAMLDLVGEVKAILEERHHPAGFNVGWNDGPAAGQTVMHFHLHVIPRYEGDVADPRGGIRWIFPDRAPYWDGD